MRNKTIRKNINSKSGLQNLFKLFNFNAPNGFDLSQKEKRGMGNFSMGVPSFEGSSAMMLRIPDSDTHLTRIPTQFVQDAQCVQYTGLHRKKSGGCLVSITFELFKSGVPVNSRWRLSMAGTVPNLKALSLEVNLLTATLFFSVLVRAACYIRRIH